MSSFEAFLVGALFAWVLAWLSDPYQCQTWEDVQVARAWLEAHLVIERGWPEGLARWVAAHLPEVFLRRY